MQRTLSKWWNNLGRKFRIPELFGEVFLDAGRFAVLVQIRFEGKGLVTDGAAVALGHRVRLHVSTQVGAVSKCLAAQFASVRFLARVRPHVALQQPRPGESLAAFRTHVRQLVREQVHRQGRHRDVALAARRTRLASAGIRIPVRLLVARKVRRRRVRFAAFVALEPAPLWLTNLRRAVGRWPLFHVRWAVRYGRSQRRISGRRGRRLARLTDAGRMRFRQRRQRIRQLQQIMCRFRFLRCPMHVESSSRWRRFRRQANGGAVFHFRLILQRSRTFKQSIQQIKDVSIFKKKFNSSAQNWCQVTRSEARWLTSGR